MKTVLGIFCKHPIPGTVKTRLAAGIGDEAATSLYEAFLTDIVERMRDAADERVLCYAPGDAGATSYFDQLAGGDYRLLPQAEGDLGDRLAAFFTQMFKEGRRKVIVIGSDCPTMTAVSIWQAEHELERRDAVLGKSHDGGYYLIGLGRLAAELFSDIDWSTSAVYHQQKNRLLGAGYSTGRLLPIPEVDTIDDLSRLIDHHMLEHCPNTRRVLKDLNLRHVLKDLNLR